MSGRGATEMSRDAREDLGNLEDCARQRVEVCCLENTNAVVIIPTRERGRMQRREMAYTKASFSKNRRVQVVREDRKGTNGGAGEGEMGSAE